MGAIIRITIQSHTEHANEKSRRSILRGLILAAVKTGWLLYGGSLVAVCVGTFCLGRSSKAQVPTAHSEKTSIPPSASLVDAPATGLPSSSMANIRVAGFGSVGFAELSDLIQAVSTEQKDRWAKEIAAMPEGPQKRLAAIALYATWIQFDAQAACASLASLPSLLLRGTIIDSVAGAAPASASRILAETVVQLTVIERRALLPGILRDWMATDPAAVAQFVDRNPKAVGNDEVGALMSEWAEVDIAAARDWLEKGPTFISDREVVSAFVGKWVQQDRAAASEYVRIHADSSAFFEAAAAVAPALYNDAADIARVFVDSLPRNTQRYAVEAILGNGQSDPSRTAETIQWASRFPAEVWTGLLGSALASWNAQDEEGVTQWIRQQPSVERERFATELCTAGGLEITPRLASLALSISDEESRSRALENLLASWRGDAEGLRSAVAALHLSPRETSSLLRAGGLPR